MNKDKNVISIRLIYIVFAIMIVIGIIIGVQKYSTKSDLQVAENEETNIYTIARTDSNTSSRTEEISRGEETLQTETADEVLTENSTENLEEDSTAKETNFVADESNELDVTIAKFIEEKNRVYTPIDEIVISRNMDLTVRTGVSRDDFITLISGVKEDTSGFFEENAGLIYDLCEEYSLNEIFFCGLISAESGWNIAQNHRNTHNYISLMTSGGLKSFSSVEAGLREAARVLHDNYLTEGGKFYYGKTLSAMKTKFCPESSTWVDLVYGRMSQIVE